MGLVFMPRLWRELEEVKQENERLTEWYSERTKQLIEEMRKRIALEGVLNEYLSLGSIEYLRKLVEADKK